ncbi:MAG: hypothetical protein WCT51_01500 [Candidatus Shapirobacteria bacterium]|jgi:hypothetical protein
MPNFNLTLSPAQIEFVLKPGITIIQAYDITNNSDSSIILNTEVLPWIPSGTNGSVNYNQAVSNPNIEFSLNNSNLQLGQPFTLAANSKQQLVLKIKTNSDINLSDNYYTFFVLQDQNTTTTSKDNFSQASGKIGSHLLLTISDTENPKVTSEIQSFSISPKIKDIFFQSITFEGKIKNNSDFFFKTNGKITITKNNQIIKELELNSDNVLNHHSRDIFCTDQTTCKINPPFWPGHYKVTVILDSSLNAKSYETSFYVWPISPLLFIVLVIGIIFGVRKFKSKPIPKV